MTVLLQKPIHKIHIKYKITNNKHRGSVPQTFTNCPFPIFFSFPIAFSQKATMVSLAKT